MVLGRPTRFLMPTPVAIKPYAYKTTDFGQTWTNIISDDVPIFARSIQEDLVNENLLFLGTEFGLYVTLDGGRGWSRYDKNVPPVSIHHLEMDPKTNDLVLGTHGRGIIIIDDVSPLGEIDQEVLGQKLHFFSSKPFVMERTVVVSDRVPAFRPNGMVEIQAPAHRSNTFCPSATLSAR